jgi:hypothetical protein
MKRTLQVEPLPGFETDVGRWLWALQEVRRYTVAAVEGLEQAALDWEGSEGGENSIGSLLYHIGLIEMSWLYMDILERPIPDAVLADFPHHVSEPGGRLARVRGLPLGDHLARLERSRARFLEEVRALPAEAWRILRRPADVDYAVTPEWAVFHLVEHEAGHLYQIRAIRARA